MSSKFLHHIYRGRFFHPRVIIFSDPRRGDEIINSLPLMSWTATGPFTLCCQCISLHISCCRNPRHGHSYNIHFANKRVELWTVHLILLIIIFPLSIASQLIIYFFCVLNVNTSTSLEFFTINYLSFCRAQ